MLTASKLLVAAILSLGLLGSATYVEAQSKPETVYITNTGKKYHRGSCQHLRKSKSAISLAEAKKRGYTPCKTCSPPK